LIILEVIPVIVYGPVVGVFTIHCPSSIWIREQHISSPTWFTCC